MEVNKRKLENWHVLDVNGNIRGKSAELFKDICLNCIKDFHLQLAINLKQVEFIDSKGLGSLISCHQKLKSAGGNFILMNLSEDIYDLLEMTSVDKLFEIIDSESELS